MADAIAPTGQSASMIGPPLNILGLGLGSEVASIILLTISGTTSHIVGYLVGSVMPLLLIGFYRRTDLERRRSATYVPSRFVRPGLILLAIGAIALVVREGIAARRVPVPVRPLRNDGGTTFHRAA